jgi:hypothetical protein
MIREKCVNTAVVYDYLLGKLDGAALEQTRTHIEGCQRCQTRLNEARQLLQFIQDDALLEVPAPVRQRNINLFRPWFETRRRELVPQPRPGLKQFLAHLVNDTRRKPGLNAGLAGLRSTAFLSRDFQLLFSLDEGRVEIDLKVSPAPQEGRYNVLGQVVGLEEEEDLTCQVELVTPDTALLPADLDETFTFQYQNLAAGTYSLKITCGPEIFEISPITL